MLHRPLPLGATEPVRSAGSAGPTHDFAATDGAADVLESMGDGYLQLDADWRVTGLNRRVEPIVGRAGSELLGRALWDEFPGWSGTPLWNACHETARSQSPSEFEEFFPELATWFAVRVYPTPERGLAIFFTNITAVNSAMEMVVRSEQRASFMARATELLFASMDYDARLAELARLAVPAIGDWCAVDLVEPDGSFRRLAVAHTDPAKIELALALDKQYPEDPASPTSRATVLATGVPAFISEIDEKMIEQAAVDAEHARIIRSLGLTAVITAPLIARDRRLGTISVVMAESGRHYSQHDVEQVMDLARRAAIAIDNARIYGEMLTTRGQLEEQALELELQATQLQEAVAELESANETLHDNATELELQTEELHRINEDLELQRTIAEGARQRMSTVLESITDAFFSVDPEWRFVYVNDRAEELLRRPSAELIGNSLWEEFPHLVGSAFERVFREATQSGSRVRAEEYHPQRQRWFELAAYPSPDGLSVYLQDVTERKTVQTALAASEAQYRFLADAIPVQVWTALPNGSLDYVSKGVTDYFARSAESMIGEGWLGVLHPDDVERTVARWISSLGSGDAYEVEFRLWSQKDATHRWHIGRATALRDATGAIVKWFGSNTDIDDQKRVEQERERLQHEAENANRAKMEFLAAMSHELRTPLNAISGYAELMDMEVVGPVTEGQRDYLARVQRSGKFLLGLINDVLNYAKLDAGRVEIDCVPVRLHIILAAAHTLVEPQLRAKGLVYSYGGCDDGITVLGDGEKIEQVILNLLTNSAKFTDEGGTITLECECGPAAARIRVSDTGRGIPQHKLETVFDPFVQVDRNDSRESQKGVGLGLAISRELARRMGGDLTAESTVGEGSTFTLTLPLSDPADEAETD